MAATPDPIDYSPSSTLIPFPHPLPLLRVPIPAAQSDDPSAGSFVLAFKDPQSWSAAYKSCESQITLQCEAGVRIGCSITASSNCSPPWYKTLFGGFSKLDFADRDKCEEREMAICVESAIPNCRKIAKEKCLPAFRDARIAMKDGKLNRRYVSNLIAFASIPDNSVGFKLLELDEWARVLFDCRFEVTNFRGSGLLGTDWYRTVIWTKLLGYSLVRHSLNLNVIWGWLIYWSSTRQAHKLFKSIRKK